MSEGAGSREALDVAMAEFKALRDEIGSRATFSHTLININVVALGVLGGLVVNNPGRVELLLILPLLGPVLGLLWLDHAHNIRNMGDYINLTLRPLVTRLASDGEHRLLAWEEHVDRYERRPWLRALPLYVPVLVLFAGVPMASLARTAGHLDTAWQGVLWGAGLLLTACFVILWIRLFLSPFKPEPSQHGK